MPEYTVQAHRNFTASVNFLCTIDHLSREEYIEYVLPVAQSLKCHFPLSLDGTKVKRRLTENIAQCVRVVGYDHFKDVRIKFNADETQCRIILTGLHLE